MIVTQLQAERISNLIVEEGGKEASIRCPKGSKSGLLTVRIRNKNNEVIEIVLDQFGGRLS